MFRDGDMKMISDFEIPQFFEGFSMFGKRSVIFIVLSQCVCTFTGADYKPKFSVVVVQKRVNARAMRIEQVS